MRIAICDDETNALEETGGIVQNTFRDMQLKCSICKFMSIDNLLKEIPQIDLVFLDIEFGDEKHNGVWAAKQIKQLNPGCLIIFTTNHEEYIDDVIEQYAFRYWSKPIDAYRLRKSAAVILDRMKTISVEVYENKTMIEIPLRNIIYITPENKHCKIVTVCGEYIISNSFKDVKDKFTTNNFCKCHGSFCVNLDYVEKYTTSHVYLKHKYKNYKVHMSRRYYQIFKKQMFIFGGSKV